LGLEWMAFGRMYRLVNGKSKKTAVLDIQYNDAYTERIILCFTGYPLSIHYNYSASTIRKSMHRLGTKKRLTKTSRLV
jgi:hypothetical protein